MDLGKIYSDGELCRILEHGLASNAAAKWPWQSISGPNESLIRRRGLQTGWGKILFDTHDTLDMRKVEISGTLGNNPHFNLGNLWGNGSAQGVYLSDLVAMHFARLARIVLSRSGWELDDRETNEVGCIFRVSAILRPMDSKRGARLGKSLAAAIIRADVANLTAACQGDAYLRGLKGFPELPTRLSLDLGRGSVQPSES